VVKDEFQLWFEHQEERGTNSTNMVIRFYRYSNLVASRAGFIFDMVNKSSETLEKMWNSMSRKVSIKWDEIDRDWRLFRRDILTPHQDWFVLDRIKNRVTICVVYDFYMGKGFLYLDQSLSLAIKVLIIEKYVPIRYKT